MRNYLSVLVFVASLCATLWVSYLGRRHDGNAYAGPLSRQRLNKWLVGLSAGATANSGFVVTGAVGLGYAYGMQWMLLPLGWLAGDILFWYLFPERINRVGREAAAATLTDLVVHGLPRDSQRPVKILIGTIIMVCLGGYVSAQWIAGQKFLSGAFGFTHEVSLLAFAAVIVVYSSLGGFRGSVYADTLQAFVRIVGTGIAITVVTVVATRHSGAFWANIGAAGPDFLSLVPGNAYWAAAASAVGFAAAALGFGLGQPQIVTRYLAGATPRETRDAWWIYLTFVQITWLAMTAFGVALRGVMPGLADPETGLSVFHRMTTGPIITGIIAADIFATIAATSNSILVAMAQTVRGDLWPSHRLSNEKHKELWLPIAVTGAITMALSLTLHSSVMALALGSLSLMGAGLAPAMIVRLLGWPTSARSLLASVVTGIVTAALWHNSPFGPIINEAAPGILAGLIMHVAAAPRGLQRTAPAR
jgi:sodium/proline symporter